MKFSALNKEASSNSTLSTPSSKKGRPTQEAQESTCLKIYHNAIQLQQEGRWEQAKAMYCEILESELMEEAGGSAESLSSSTVLRLKFLIYKNVASIAKEQGDISAAVDAYIEATRVDMSDVTVWCQLASLAALLGNLLLSRKSLEQALCCHLEYWPAIENLCTVLYALGDFTACLQIVGKGLQMDPFFPRGLVYLQQIAMNSPEILDSKFPQLRTYLMNPQPDGRTKFLEDAEDMSRRQTALNDVIVISDPITPPKKLSSLTVFSLASSLLSLYKHCRDLSQRIGSYTVPVDLSSLTDTLPTTSSPPADSVCTAAACGVDVTVSQSQVDASTMKVEEEGKSSGSGRRRKLSDGLELFAPKRRSTRMMSKRKDKDHQSYFEMLSKYLPAWLMMRELPDVCELSPLKKPQQPDEDERQISERKQQVSALIDSTPHLPEPELVRGYVEEFQTNLGVIHILYQFIRLLSLNYNCKWSQSDSLGLRRLFVENYECLHSHLCYPSPLCSPIEAQGKTFNDVAMVALCYVEMYVDSYKGKRRSQTPEPGNSTAASVKTCKSFMECLEFVQLCSGQVGHSALEKVTYTLRVQWCLSKWYQFSGKHDGAIQALTMCRDLLQVFVPVERSEIEEESSPVNLVVYLPNCSNESVISIDHVTEQMKELEDSISLKHIKELFDKKEYSNVVGRLQPFLEYSTTIPSDFLMGTDGPSSTATNLSLLLDSLFHLEKYHVCLQTAVQACLQLLQNYQLGSHFWTVAVRNVFRSIESCLDSHEGLEQLKEQYDGRLLKRLVVCVLKVMDVIYDMVDTEYFIFMPISLPWKIFYIIIATDWKMSLDLENVQTSNTNMVKGGQTQPLSPSCTIMVPTQNDSLEQQPMKEERPLEQRSDVMVEEKGPLEQRSSVIVEERSDVMVEEKGPLEERSDVMVEEKGPLEERSDVMVEEKGPLEERSDVMVEEEGPLEERSDVMVEEEGPLEERSSMIVEERSDVMVEERSGVMVEKKSVLEERSGVKEGPLEGVVGPLEEKGDVEEEPLGGMDVRRSLKEAGSVKEDGAGITTMERSSEEEELNHFHVPCPPASPEFLLRYDDSNSPSTPVTSFPSMGDVDASIEDDLNPSLKFLCEAHEHLGQMGWCCKDSGSFLIESVTVLRRELQILTRLPPKQRDVLLQELEQCYYCLYGHPNKRAKIRGLVDHGAEQIPLKWESALMLIEHYHPVPLPSIDDTKSPQVTAEVISLYKRIITVLPDHGKVMSKDCLDGFIEGVNETLTDIQPPHQQSSIISDVYYILADDALNSMDNHKAIRYYQENLCYCPDRFDSWAGLALGRSRIILEKLNQRDFKSGMERYICKHVAGTVVCFKKAVSLNAKHCYIVEKFGFFCYAVQSFASQILHQCNLFVLTGIHPWASSSQKEMLELAENCFSQALGLEGTLHAEPWLYHWMLGKVCCKRHHSIEQSMAHFVKSAEILHSDGACYPDLVEFSSKNHAVEAIEVHYQLHSAPLKCLLHFHLTSSSIEDNEKERVNAKDNEKERVNAKDNEKERVNAKDNEKERVNAERSVAEALKRVKELPLSQQSYPVLWEWTREIFREAFRTMSDLTLPTAEKTVTSGGPPTLTENPPTTFAGGLCGVDEVAGERDLLDIAEETGEEEMEVDVVAIEEGIPVGLQSHVQSHDKSHENTVTSDKCIVNTYEYVSLLQLCFYGVAVCWIRCPAFFKPLYRMAVTLHTIGLPHHARALLLGPLPPALVNLQEKLQPLFVLKSNIFTNMWQIPTEEINRPGSFCSHARQSLELLLDVLVKLKEASVLYHLAQHLKTKPDATKQYLRDNERVFIHKKIVKQCVKVLVDLSDEDGFTSEEAEKLKTVATSIRSMANRLESVVIKELDEAIKNFQVFIKPSSPVTIGTTITSLQ